jgi:hypothetical protein
MHDAPLSLDSTLIPQSLLQGAVQKGTYYG